MDFRQVSGTDIKQNTILSGILKIEYNIDLEGRCTKINSEGKIINDFVFGDEQGILLNDDIDLYAFKPLTDIIVKGHLYNHKLQSIFQASINVEGRKEFSILGLGKRNAFSTNTGVCKFSEPTIESKIELNYKNAYGGQDDYTLSVKKSQDELDDYQLMAIADGDFNPFNYPRNPVGKGWVINEESLKNSELELPQLEYPNQLLSPNNLFVNHQDNWINKVLPRSTGWFNLTWFPRVAYIGFPPEFWKSNLRGGLPELQDGLVESDILQEKAIENQQNIRAANGASLGLQFPYLKGNEKIRLTNIHPTKQDFVLQLPGDRPKIWVDGRNGTLKPTTPVIHTIVIEPDEGRLSIVWRGSAPALRPYMDEELKTMPFKVEW
jgi:hypothetical protein